MQIAVTGTFDKGVVQLHEVPPITERTDVMVVFLPKTSEAELVSSTPKKIKSAKELKGILSHYGKLTDADIKKGISQGALDGAFCE